MAREARRLWRENSCHRPVLTPAPLSTLLPTSSSSFSEVIVLSDWWLVKSEIDVDGKRLAVRGHLNSGETTMPVFTSAPIAKRLNVYTLETADGSTLRLRGAINQKYMQDNGFPPEISRCFFMGFPCNWFYYAKQYFGNDPMIHRSAAPSTNSANRNEGQFPIHVAGDFPLLKFLVDCASNPDSSLDDLLIKTAEMHNASVRNETISRPDKDNTDEERCIKHNSLELHDGVTCEHSASSLNVNCENQNEITQRLQVESLSKKGSEINNEKMNFENTVDSAKLVDEVSFKSPQAYATRNVDTESDAHSGVKVSPTILSPYTRSVLCNMRNKNLCDLKYSVKRIRVNPSNDDSDAPATSKGSQRITVDSAFYENTSILSQHGKESNTKDPENNIKSNENQTEATQEAKLNSYKKTRNQMKAQLPSISEEGSITSVDDANKLNFITEPKPRRRGRPPKNVKKASLNNQGEESSQ